jgi:hypothetical protein
MRDLPSHGRPTTLVASVAASPVTNAWNDLAKIPEIILDRDTHVTRRLARQLVRDVNAMWIREVSTLHLPWHFIMAPTPDWSDRVAVERRRHHSAVLLIDEISLRRD